MPAGLVALPVWQVSQAHRTCPSLARLVHSNDTNNISTGAQTAEQPQVQQLPSVPPPSNNPQVNTNSGSARPLQETQQATQNDGYPTGIQQAGSRGSNTAAPKLTSTYPVSDDTVDVHERQVYPYQIQQTHHRLPRPEQMTPSPQTQRTHRTPIHTLTQPTPSAQSMQSDRPQPSRQAHLSPLPVREVTPELPCPENDEYGIPWTEMSRQLEQMGKGRLRKGK